MNVALGLKAHSGWAALIVAGRDDNRIQVVERIRIELVLDKDASWAKQPFHAAENLPAREASDLVNRATESARRLSICEMAAAVERAHASNHRVVACGLIMPGPMPEWSIDEILAVHFRMHKAEGVLFPDALHRAARINKLAVTEIPEKELETYAQRTLGRPIQELKADVDAVGKIVGPPWSKDQKCATFAALIALEHVTTRTR